MTINGDGCCRQFRKFSGLPRVAVAFSILTVTLVLSYLYQSGNASRIRATFYGENPAPRSPSVTSIDFFTGISRLNLSGHYEPCRELVEIRKTNPDVSWPEDSALLERPLQDHLDTTNASLSKLTLVSPGNRTRLYVGDTVTVVLTLFDGRGRRVTRGGDHILVWMREKGKRGSISAHLTDNQDGTHTARLPVTWEGKLEIVAALDHTRQIIETLHRRRHICPQVAHEVAVFSHDTLGISETTLCDHYPHITGYRDICNLTSQNYGHAWYCGMPRDPRLGCHEWTGMSYVRLGLGRKEERALYTKAEVKLFNRTGTAAAYFKMTLNLVSMNKKAKESINSLPKCCEVPPSQTWSLSSPVGYFYNNTWTNLHCRGPGHKLDVKSCMANTHLFLYGDSTLRQWYSAIESRGLCKFSGKVWGINDKHQAATCYNPGINFTFTWAPHQLHFQTASALHINLKPLDIYLQNLKQPAKVIIIVHLFSHFMSYHSSVFRAQMEDIKTQVGHFMSSYPEAILFVKGPHYWPFEEKKIHVVWMFDKYADILEEITKEVFGPISHRVKYLDYRDMSIASENAGMHPSNGVINEMVDQMLYYTCPY